MVCTCFSKRINTKWDCVRIIELLPGMFKVTAISVLQIKRGNTDNLGMIFHISPYEHASILH